MTARKNKPILSKQEMEEILVHCERENKSPFLSPAQLAELCGVSPKTIYAWIAAGRLDGAFRKRGKRLLIVRDKALNLLLNGPDWK